MAAPETNQRLALSYVLWIAGFFGASGLHRIYNGKITTGLIWFFTLGLFGVGQFIDVFLVPGMAEEHQLKRLKSQHGSSFYDFFNTPSTTVQNLHQPTRDEKMLQLVKAAHKKGGHLSVTQAVLETGLGFEEAESLLKQMAQLGYVGIDNHPDTGIVIYRFHELVV